MFAERLPPFSSRELRVVAACFLLLLTGCPSFTSFRTARSLAPGQLQLTAAAEALGLTKSSGTVEGARPSLGFAARYGVGRGVDLGVKVDPVAGVEADTTLQLVRGKVDVALGPGLAYFSTPAPVSFGPRTIENLAGSPDYTIVAPSLPVFFGVNLGQGDQLVLAPRATAWFVQAQAAQPGAAAISGGMEIFTGLSAGISLKTIGNVRLMPEIDVMVPTVWTGESPGICTGTACPPINGGAVILQGGIALVVGPDDLGP